MMGHMITRLLQGSLVHYDDNNDNKCYRNFRSVCDHSGSSLSQKFFGNFVRIRSLIWDPKRLLPLSEEQVEK